LPDFSFNPITQTKPLKKVLHVLFFYLVIDHKAVTDKLLLLHKTENTNKDEKVIKIF